MEKIKNRLFWGAKIHAPWPSLWPKGRLIEEQYRHTTLVFLGTVSDPDLKESLKRAPPPAFKIGSRGYFDSILLLPEKRPRVAAWHIHWFDEALSSFQLDLTNWLKANGFSLEDRTWLSHVTVCRNPLSSDAWKESFQPLPCYAGSISLYESLGHSRYRSLLSISILPPFEEMEHTADIAFRVYGNSLQDLYESAFSALAFRCPDLLAYYKKETSIQSLEDIVILLNDAVSQTDRFVGCPFKAVSFHGEVSPFKTDLLQWEMIIDV